MSCNNYTPCHEPTCNDCNPVNPCYDNCGCLNPTTWECVNNPGTQSSLGVVNTDNGKSVLSKINTKISSILASLGLVKADDTDLYPDSLIDKLSEGVGITLAVTGSGSSKKVEINATTGGTPPYTVKVVTGTAAGFLNDRLVNGTYVKKTISGDDMYFDIVPADLLSTDSGNALTIGSDLKLKTNYQNPDGSETKISIVPNTGLTITGTGTIADPYLLSGNPAIMPLRTRFNGVWKSLTFTGVLPSGVTIVGGNTAKYRMRFDGSIEFKGSISLQVPFATNGIVNCFDLSNTIETSEIGTSGQVSSGVKSYVITELTNTADLKNVTYLDSNNVIDVLPKQTSYIIRSLFW